MKLFRGSMWVVVGLKVVGGRRQCVLERAGDGDGMISVKSKGQSSGGEGFIG